MTRLEHDQTLSDRQLLKLLKNSSAIFVFDRLKAIYQLTRLNIVDDQMFLTVVQHMSPSAVMSTLLANKGGGGRGAYTSNDRS